MCDGQTCSGRFGTDALCHTRKCHWHLCVKADEIPLDGWIVNVTIPPGFGFRFGHAFHKLHMCNELGLLQEPLNNALALSVTVNFLQKKTCPIF
jgi:hypothetical protein